MELILYSPVCMIGYVLLTEWNDIVVVRLFGTFLVFAYLVAISA